MNPFLFGYAFQISDMIMSCGMFKPLPVIMLGKVLGKPVNAS